MSLKDLQLKFEYETLADDLVEEFYVPILKHCTIYKRAVGFFSSSVLLQISKGLSHLIANNGKMQLLISPRLDKNDYDAVEHGYSLKEALEKKIIDSFDEFVDYEQREDRFGMLSYMIAHGFLEIKVVALEKDNDKAMYHEKLGIAIDELDNYVCFSGSLNDSDTALNYNYESIDVFCSWKSQDSEERCISKEVRFKRMWNGLERGLVTIPFPEIIKSKLLKYEKQNVNYVTIDEEFIKNNNLNKLVTPKHYPTLKYISGLRDYQISAIDKWEEYNYKGIFDMATGTGKTYTGCGAIVRLFENVKRVFAIICCPYIHLVEQWCDEVKSFGIDPIKCYGDLDYKLSFKRAVNKFRHHKSDFECVIVVNDTFKNDFFQSTIQINLKHTLLIVDEAHNFGALKLKECLNVDYPFRLALSATLDRYGDVEGTKNLYDFFGDKCIEYSLAEAIATEKLTPYNYHPVIVNLTPDELEVYKELTIKIGKLVTNKKDSDAIKKLLLKRARLIASATNKLGILENLLQDYKDKNNMLIYCGAVKYGDVEYNDISGEVKQIDLVINMLNRKLNIKALKFTSDEDSKQRKNIISAFKDNIVQALVAIKCLDEGMNIPSIKTAFILASSTNPKEYIQRRGRVLRIANGKKVAEIYDFITLPFSLEEVQTLSHEKKKGFKGLINRELARFYDFVKLAKNAPECNAILDKIKSNYNLDIITDIEEASLYE